MATVYGRIAKISNVVGRSDYLNDEKRQEKIVLKKIEMQYSWQEHSSFEKEQLNDRLDKFAYNQQVMNQQIIELNDNITDTASLNALYEAKRKELDLNYRNQETVLKEQIKHLSEHIEYKENKLNTINKSIESKQEELDRISADLKNKEFWINFKNVWINKWIAFVSAGFLLVFIGGFLGWPTYKVMNSVFKIIRSVF